MNEKDFYKKLEEINQNVLGVQKAVRPKLARVFGEGLLRGAGSLIGIVLAIALIGWVLNMVGVIPAFRDSVNEWQELLDKATSQSGVPNVNTGGSR